MSILTLCDDHIAQMERDLKRLRAENQRLHEAIFAAAIELDAARVTCAGNCGVCGSSPAASNYAEVVS